MINPTPQNLVKILSEASDLYHNTGESFLSDEEYDSYLNLLKQLEPNNLFLSQIGSDVRGGKIDLPYPMGSLDQVYEGETLDWVVKNGWEDELFVITDKQDGVSALNIHVGGKLKISYSRGNGFQGADITRHMSKIKTLPTESSETAAIRLEVIMSEETFDRINTDKQYKNSRNYVAGRMNASVSPDIFYESVKLVATSIVDPKYGKVEQLVLMKQMGYEVTPWITVKGRELTDEFLETHLKTRRLLSDTAIDGLVIDLDSAELRSKLRRKSSSINPMYSKKFKLGSEENRAITEVVDVHWNASKDGYLKPRIEVKPVDLMGVTISFTTGFNAKYIVENNIGPGAMLQITRSGDVIPYIERTLSPSPTGPKLPTEVCKWNETEVDLVLTDLENREVQIERINGFFGGIDVPNLRKTSIEKLFEHGYTSIEQIIKMPEDKLMDILGPSSGHKIYTGIKAKLADIDVHILAGASSLLGRGMGRRKIKSVVDALGSETLLNGTVTKADLISVDGFEEKSANVLLTNLPKFISFMESIEGYYSFKEKQTMGTDLSGVVIAFTGIRDKELEAIIESRGGKVGGINKNTTYLVAKDPEGSSSKLAKARELGIKIITLPEAREL